MHDLALHRFALGADLRLVFLVVEVPGQRLADLRHQGRQAVAELGADPGRQAIGLGPMRPPESC